MHTSTLNDLKKELATLNHDRVLDICLRIVKYKKENKELLSYILFQSIDENTFVLQMKEDMDFQFSEINRSNLYLVKKSMRKILRNLNKYIKYSGIEETEIDLRIYFCNKMDASKFDLQKSMALTNMYQNQISKVRKLLQSMHEDLQYDYLKQLPH